MLLTLHSGANNTKANSKEYLLNSLKYNADFVEVDVRETKDGILILHHDNFIGDLIIEENCFSKLFDLDSDLLKVNDVIIFAKENNLKLNFDLKNSSALLSLSKIISANDLEDSCVISGCKEKEYQQLIKLNPNLNIIYNIDDFENIQKQLLSLMDKNIYGINLNYLLCNNPLFYNIENLGKRIFVWTVDDEDSFKALKAKKISGITTNYPDMFKKYF